HRWTPHRPGRDEPRTVAASCTSRKLLSTGLCAYCLIARRSVAGSNTDVAASSHPRSRCETRVGVVRGWPFWSPIDGSLTPLLRRFSPSTVWRVAGSAQAANADLVPKEVGRDQSRRGWALGIRDLHRPGLEGRGRRD